MNDFNSSISNSVSSTPNAKWASIGPVFPEEGHIYSLAYTGSECNSLRVWKNMKAVEKEDLNWNEEIFIEGVRTNCEEETVD